MSKFHESFFPKTVEQLFLEFSVDTLNQSVTSSYNVKIYQDGKLVCKISGVHDFFQLPGVKLRILSSFPSTPCAKFLLSV